VTGEKCKSPTEWGGSAQELADQVMIGQEDQVTISQGEQGMLDQGDQGMLDQGDQVMLGQEDQATLGWELVRTAIDIHFLLKQYAVSYVWHERGLFTYDKQASEALYMLV
jgi:hypothetical protein